MSQQEIFTIAAILTIAAASLTLAMKINFLSLSGIVILLLVLWSIAQ